MKHKVSAVRQTALSKADRREVRKGLMLALCGGLALAGLFGLTHFVRLDSLLVVSQAIFNVISGVKGIAEGIGQLLLGLAQMVGFAALALVAVMGVLAVVSGSVRIGLKLLPQLESTWNLLAHGLNHLTLLVSLPQRQNQGKGESKRDSRSVTAMPASRSASVQRAA
jgi:hypothetical protein